MDLNMMMRQTAQASLEAQHEQAVKDGDTEKAKALVKQIADLAVQTAPAKAPGPTDAEIKAELNTLDWFGTDPVKSEKAMQAARNMAPQKFATAKDFVAAIVKVLEPAASAAEADDGDDDAGEGDDAKPEPKQRRTDGPKDGDLNNRGRAKSGPWTKLSDAPSDVQREVKRQADKFVPAGAKAEVRENFIANALASHYQMHQQKKGK